MLSEQLNGTMPTENSSGTSWRVTRIGHKCFRQKVMRQGQQQLIAEASGEALSFHDKGHIYERFKRQMDTVHYEKYVSEGVNVVAAQDRRGAILGYDPNV